MPLCTLPSSSDHHFLSLSPALPRFKFLPPPRVSLTNPTTSPVPESPKIVNSVGKASSFSTQLDDSGNRNHARIVKSNLTRTKSKDSELLVRCTDDGSASSVSARLLFDETTHRKAVCYAAKIGTHSRARQWGDVLSVFVSMVQDGAVPDKFLVPKILKACSELQSLGFGAGFHGYIVRARVDIDVFVGNSLINMYAKCGDLASAQAVFGWMPERDVVSWTALTNAYADSGLLDEASNVFNSMRASGVRPDLISWNALVSGFARNGDIDAALCLLEEMKADGVKLGTNSWNGVISGCVQNGYFEDALEVFREMSSSENPNAVTIASILPACSGLKAANLGMELHSYVIRNRIELNVFVGGSLIDMYLKCGKFRFAELVFLELRNKNVTVWNEMIAAYANDDKMNEALELFHLMQEDGLKPDVVTYNIFIAAYAKKGLKEEAFKILSEMGRASMKPNVISMNALISGFHHCGLHDEALELFRTMQCPTAGNTNSMVNCWIQPNAVTITSALLVLAELKLHHLGKQVHNYALRNCFESNVFVSSMLVDMYAKCGDMSSAATVFYGTRDKNIVSWNILMAAYNHNQKPEVALKLFQEMLNQNFFPSSITLMIVLLSCSMMLALRVGRELHGYIEKNRPDGYPVTLASALIDMYAKCGNIKDAKLVFDCTVEKDIAVWNTMLAGYSLHRMAKDAISLFKEIEKSNVKPDHISFTAFFSACNQEGFTDEAWKYFNIMEDVYGVTPTLEHFTCMIDLMGNAGLLEESLDIITKMPFEPDACLWATLLKSCRLHSNHEIGEKAAKVLFELEPHNASNYIVLSNIFSTVGMWDSATRIRNTMRDRGLSMVRQRSWLYVGSSVHSFKAGDCSHPDMGMILDVWNKLAEKMKEDGYVPQDIVFCDEREVDPFTCYHTEKLAVCLGLISMHAQGPICVSKNVRMCMDCHSSTKLISKYVTREIFISDGCSYHHFKGAICSCRDQW
ncbi:pentatricopeptide repeat-containing protein At1g20230-like [Typha angustifolia]|uniref:pentatricopeptide repeat-containing protein At1g20230-like n=1 Tax=Typha angustifolia TaxID=59011 RepID=UPI003C2D0207